MNTRPILFSGPMVRAILDGRKTQTRRIVKLRSPWEIEEQNDGSPWPWYPDYVTGGEWDGWVNCPYGQPGDRLWVRETWAPYDQEALVGKVLEFVFYRADDERKHDTDGKWRPSIHMPRWASRITLEVTGVRVERLHAISEADAIAEGCAGGHGSIPGYAYSASPSEHFRSVWGSINGAESWAANPWVWVVEFRRVKPTMTSCAP